MYPGPYRLADVDDIIQNTTGGGVGYSAWLVPGLVTANTRQKLTSILSE